MEAVPQIINNECGEWEGVGLVQVWGEEAKKVFFFFNAYECVFGAMGGLE